jgi:hypothetical protein
LSADRALNPEPPAYKAVALTSWSYRPVGHLGVEPSYTALSERPLRPDGPWPMNLARRRGGRYALPVTPPFEAGSATHSRRTLTCQERKMEVSSPTVLPVARVQAPLRRRPRIFHERRAEGMIPSAKTPIRLRNGPDP